MMWKNRLLMLLKWLASWMGIIRLGLVQTALGAIIVLTTSTFNRVMIVELNLLAIIPGLLVAWHYALQILRPRWGHGSDNGGKRTPWIIGGMATLALGGSLAALSVMITASHLWAGLALATLAFTLIGIGVGAAGTSLLVLLAETVVKERRPAAATIVWTMMIVGFIITTVFAEKFLEPFTLLTLVKCALYVCLTALIVSTIAVLGLEGERTNQPVAKKKETAFTVALADVWSDIEARHFAIFIFMSMLAYSAQDLILEPFAGFIFNFTPAESTALAKVQNTGVLLGMVLVGVAATWLGKAKGLTLRNWTVAGCLLSACALIGLVSAARFGTAWPLKQNVFALGFANGVFAVAAIGSMFSAAMGGKSREGVRMGLFGASQAIAFGAGGFVGTALADILKATTQSNAISYGSVFAIEACLFVISAILALQISGTKTKANPFVLAAQHDLGHST
jgi:MFS transporter, BCD family, chlorophyll transporter